MGFVYAVFGVLCGLGGGLFAGRLIAAGAFHRADDPAARPVSWLAPVTAVAAGATVYGLADHPWIVAVTGTVAAVVGVALAALDAQVHRIPRVVTWPAYPVLALLLTACSWAGDDWAALRRAAWVAAASWAAYYLLHLIARRRGLGRGDVTLAGLIGGLLGWFSWPAALVTVYVTFILAGCWAAFLLLTRRATRSTAIAFGPFMVAAALILLALQ